MARTTNYWQLFRTLELQLSSFLGDAVENYFLLHAGAVTKGGAGIIFPGPSGSGKSSLTAALLFQGYRYLSDEMVPVNPITIQADCFPKALSIKDRSVFPLLHLAEHRWIGPETSDNGAVWYLHPEDLASQAISDPVHISHIIFPTYKSDGKAKLEPLPANQAATKLIENSINFSKFGRDGLGLVADLVKGAQCYSLTMNGIGPTTELIDELVTKTV